MSVFLNCKMDFPIFVTIVAIKVDHNKIWVDVRIYHFKLRVRGAAAFNDSFHLKYYIHFYY